MATRHVRIEVRPGITIRVRRLTLRELARVERHRDDPIRYVKRLLKASGLWGLRLPVAFLLQLVRQANAPAAPPDEGWQPARDADPYWVESLVDVLASEYSWTPEMIMGLLLIEIHALLRKREIRRLREMREAITVAMLPHAEPRQRSKAIRALDLDIERLLPGRIPVAEDPRYKGLL